MKKRILGLLITAICGTFSACNIDYVYTTDFYIVNDNDHDAVVEIFGVSKPGRESKWNVPSGETCFIVRDGVDDGLTNLYSVLGDSVRITFSDSSFVMYYGIPGYGVSRSNAENDIYKEQNWDMGKWDEDRMRDAYYFIR